MTELVEAFNISLNHPGESDLATMRANWYFLLMSIGAVGIRDQKAGLHVPGWATAVISSASPGDYDHPDYITLTKTYTDVSPNVTVQFRYNLTWTGDNLTEIIYQYDDGTGLETVTGGTITLSYDGLGNFTGATSA